MKGTLCKVPGCGRYTNAAHLNHGLCQKHKEMLQFFIWALDNVKFKEKEPTPLEKAGIVIPKV